MTRPAAAVDQRKQRLLTLTALDYLRLLKNPRYSSGSISWRCVERWRGAGDSASAQRVSDGKALSICLNLRLAEGFREIAGGVAVAPNSRR